MQNRIREIEDIKEPIMEITPDSVGISLAEFLLSPNIPEAEKEKFRTFSVLFSNLIALGNIERWERVEYVCAFEEIMILLEIGAYERARQLQGLVLMELQLSRSIKAIGMITMSTSTTQRTLEEVHKEDKVVKKGILGKILGG